MKKLSNRAIRMSKVFKKHISDILYFYIKDPRIKFFLIVSKVIVSNNLSSVKIFIVFINNVYKFSVKRILFFLQKSSKYFCYLLSKRINLRIIPNLIFLYDFSFIQGIKISNLIKKVIKEDNIKKK